jgi:phosphoglucosamine mutase
MDCANGSLWDFAPKFFKKLNFNLFTYGCSPNGNNINQDCGALEQHKLSEMTLRHNSDIGISFDGDADRVIICDNKGKIIDGDYILAIIAYRLKKDQNKNISIVSTKMSNLSFRKYIENINIKLSLSDVGDRYVVEKMKNTNSFVGGEPSGHIIFSDNSYCGDGILTALYILGILEEEKITLSDLCDLLFIKTPQRLLNFKLNDNNQNLINSQKVERLINKYEDKDCEIILRKSGTENVLRLMIQSSEEGDINDFIKLFSNIINEKTT